LRNRKLPRKHTEGIVCSEAPQVGISDPFDIPEHPKIRVDTTGKSPMQAAQ
jgi:adenylylsulfate kinase-like enzyme